MRHLNVYAARNPAAMPFGLMMNYKLRIMKAYSYQRRLQPQATTTAPAAPLNDVKTLIGGKGSGSGVL